MGIDDRSCCCPSGVDMVSDRQAKNTAPPFSKEEVTSIREAVLKTGATVDCPRCDSPLTIETATNEAHISSWWIHCTECRRNLVVRDVK